MNEEDFEEYSVDDDDTQEFYAIRPNKTRLKKEIADIFSMVEEICELTPAQIAEFELPENIETALIDVGKLGPNSARKRLLKFITGQFRNLDLQAIREKLARITNRSAHATREHHQTERWRDQLLSDTGSEFLTRFISEYPEADSQYLRQLQRNAQKESHEAKPPKSSRLLYKYLKGLISGEE
jgi:ribosome-associated protein